MKIKKIIAFIMVFAMLFCLCACGNNNSDVNEIVRTESEMEALKKTAPRFTVTVVDGDGNPVEGVILQMSRSTTFTARTNNSGIAYFYLAVIDNYRLSIKSCPDGYQYIGDTYINIEPNSTKYTLEISKK